MFSRHFLLFLLLVISNLSVLAQKNTEKRLLYCREDLELTGLYPLSKSTYLAVDWGEKKRGGEVSRARSIVLRLIGDDGLSKDSLVFINSINEVAPISAKRVLINNYSSSYIIDIVDGKLIKRDSIQNLRDLKWLLTDASKTEIKSNTIRGLKRSAKTDLKKIKGIHEFGVYGDWAVYSRQSNSKNAKKKQLLYSVINTKTKEVIAINQIEDLLSSKWQALDFKFNYWKRTVFFIGDKVYFSHPDTGKCYQFDINTKQISFFSFPQTDKGLWFFTYDYVKKKQYLVKHDRGTFDLYLFSGPDEKLIHLKQTGAFDNYIFNDAILLPEKEKGNQGKVNCFYVLPIYEETREWN